MGREFYDHEHHRNEMHNTFESPADPAALDEAVGLLQKMFPPGVPPAQRGTQHTTQAG